MADLLFDLLVSSAPEPGPAPAVAADTASLEYLATLASQPISALDSTEPLALSHESHRLLLSLQALSKKSHGPIIESAAHHATLPSALPALAASAAELRGAIPRLDAEAVRFSTAFGKSSENDVLARRRRALLLSRGADRLVDVLELPTLLSSAVSSAPPNYSSALDLNGHVRRLQALYPDSPLVYAVAAQTDNVMRDMAANLVQSLRAPGLKLAASLRTIGWLRRVLPDIEAAAWGGSGGGGIAGHTPGRDRDSKERVLGALFLVCRLAMLTTMLEALAPLRDLADQERSKHKLSLSTGGGIAAGDAGKGVNAWSGGQQTEKYLKKYIEIFREQSFAIVSMYRSIFPSDPTPASTAASTTSPTTSAQEDPLSPLPTPLATFPLHLVDLLLDTLRLYLPTVRDQASRDSLLTQVLYCAGSLGRLGGDFGLFLAALDVGGEAEEEWVQVIKRHRHLAGRLKSIVGDQKEKGGFKA